MEKHWSSKITYDASSEKSYIGISSRIIEKLKILMGMGFDHFQSLNG